MQSIIQNLPPMGPEEETMVVYIGKKPPLLYLELSYWDDHPAYFILPPRNAITGTWSTEGFPVERFKQKGRLWSVYVAKGLLELGIQYKIDEHQYTKQYCHDRKAFIISTVSINTYCHGAGLYSPTYRHLPKQ